MHTPAFWSFVLSYFVGMSFEVLANVLDRPFLPNILPENGVGMALRVEVGAEGLDRLGSGKDCFEMAFSTLLLFVVGQDFHVVLCKLRESFQERGDHCLLSHAIGLRGAPFKLVRRGELLLEAPLLHRRLQRQSLLSWQGSRCLGLFLLANCTAAVLCRFKPEKPMPRLLLLLVLEFLTIEWLEAHQMKSVT